MGETLGEGIDNLKSRLDSIKEEGRRKIREEARKEISLESKQIVSKQEKAGAIISRLYKAVKDNPNSTEAELLNLVHEASAPVQVFSEIEFKQLEAAIRGYESKHTIVKKYLAENKDPQVLFEQCFGRKPNGQVEVIGGAMTICFRCFEEEDYVFAYTHSSDPIPHSLEEEIEKAKKSGGAALRDVLLPDLQGMVILEKASNNRLPELTWSHYYVEKMEEGKGYQVQLEPQRVDNMVWAVGNKKICELHFAKDESGKVREVIVWDGNNNLLASGPLPSGNDASLQPKEVRIDLPNSEFWRQQWLTFKLSSDKIGISGRINERVTIYDGVKDGNKWKVGNKDISENIRIHEEQHQFNKLFIPSEQTLRKGEAFKDPVKEWNILDSRAETKGQEEAKRALLHKLAINFRQQKIDPKARDEIIAYYKDGRSVKEIIQALKTSELYDYKNTKVKFSNGEEISLAKHIENLMIKGLKQWLGPNHSIKTIYFSDVEKAADEALNKAYLGYTDDQQNYHKGSLDMWGDQILRLEKMGYKREDIVSLLSTLPANKWRAFANRLEKSKNSK